MTPLQIYVTNLVELRTFPKGNSLEQLADSLRDELGFVPMNARVDNYTLPLTAHIYEPCAVQFMGIDTESGSRTYMRSLCFLLSKAIDEVLPAAKLRVLHSLANGYYCEIKSSHEVTEQELALICEHIDRLIEADLPFEERTVPTEEAIALFREQGNMDKISLIESIGMPYCRYAVLDGYADTYYGSLVPRTGYIYLYDLVRYMDGFLLRVPERTCPQELAPYEEQTKMRHVMAEQKRLLEMLELSHLGDVNKAIQQDATCEMIHICEAMQEKQIAAIAEDIAERYVQGVRVILISGPSSSGKTTFTKRLYTQLRTCFLRPHMISLDDFFIDRERTPRTPEGNYDFESLYALDLETFNSTLSRLLVGETVPMPTFDFYTGKRVYNGRKLHLVGGDLLMLEGIHALNPELVSELLPSSLYRIYVSALTALSLDDHNRISTTDNRLLRRIVRDARDRGYSAIDTLSRWSLVREGEERWVFPFQENADSTFNSAMPYELGALRPLAEQHLLAVPSIVPEYSEAQRLLRFLRMVYPVAPERMPGNSLLREFIGGSALCYK